MCERLALFLHVQIRISSPSSALRTPRNKQKTAYKNLQGVSCNVYAVSLSFLLQSEGKRRDWEIVRCLLR